mmetsp:Transcript_61397/g.180094  ORF Transcript_61397/g.180094 Transcript_61397/m.180094 type:complete len:380 (-) Transcript_61397:33-1172(-)
MDLACRDGEDSPLKDISRDLERMVSREEAEGNETLTPRSSRGVRVSALQEAAHQPRWKILAGLCLAVALVTFVCLRSSPSSRALVSQENLRPESKAAVGAREGCHTAIEGETCFDKIKWAMTTGLKTKPHWYPGLNNNSSMADFQRLFERKGYFGCQKPCKGDEVPAKALPLDQCLCLFDVDRTITGKQGNQGWCPNNKVFGGILDDAYGGGDLALSVLGQNLLGTFCGACHLGIVSMGGAGGPQEKEVIAMQVMGGKAGSTWSGPGGPGLNGSIISPLVIGCANQFKARCSKGIVDWYARARGVHIPPQEVYFFDDTTGNTRGFADFGFNARQVSCPTRAEPIGLCGGLPWEIQRVKGIFDCPPPATPAPAPAPALSS